MSVMPYATVVGVFRDRSAADLAMQALANAGFKREQMRYLAAETSGGFLNSLKSVFTGLSPEEESLVSNLTDMGLSSAEAQYFSDEYARGSAILAIKTQGDEEMALNILYEYGAYNAKERARFSGVMANPNRPISSEAPNAYVAPAYAGAVSPEPLSSQPQGAATYSTPDYQQNEAGANASVDVPSPQAQPPLFDFTPLAYSVETTPRANSILPSEDVSDSLTEPFPQAVATNPDTPLPQEDANNLNTPLSQEDINNPRAPLPQEVVSNTDTPFPQDASNNMNAPLPQEIVSAHDAPFLQEAEQTQTDQVDEFAPEQEETDVIEEAVTPAYSDEQVSLVNPEVMEVVEIDEIGESETPVDQTNADVYPQNSSAIDPEPQTLAEADTEPLARTNTDAYPQNSSVTDAEPQNADLSAPQMADIPAEQSTQEPTLETNGNDVATRTSELQQLLTQIETTKQQLAEARSQLEEARQHESQLTTARLQLKELQAELQATHAELQQTQQRITG